VRVVWHVRLAIAVLIACGASAAPAAAAGGTLGISLDRSAASTQLGKSFGFSSSITNTGGRTLKDLVAHLDVVSLSSGVYVDPEDWSDQRTRYLPPLEPGGSTKVDWKVKAVNGGNLAVYVVVVPTPVTAPPGPTISTGLQAHITERRTLNSGGVLPLALGVPALIGLVTLGVRRRRGRA
jgi:hypothetical protein